MEKLTRPEASRKGYKSSHACLLQGRQDLQPGIARRTLRGALSHSDRSTDLEARNVQTDRRPNCGFYGGSRRAGARDLWSRRRPERNFKQERGIYAFIELRKSLNSTPTESQSPDSKTTEIQSKQILRQSDKTWVSIRMYYYNFYDPVAILNHSRYYYKHWRQLSTSTTDVSHYQSNERESQYKTWHATW